MKKWGLEKTKNKERKRPQSLNFSERTLELQARFLHVPALTRTYHAWRAMAQQAGSLVEWKVYSISPFDRSRDLDRVMQYGERSMEIEAVDPHLSWLQVSRYA